MDRDWLYLGFNPPMNFFLLKNLHCGKVGPNSMQAPSEIQNHRKKFLTIPPGNIQKNIHIQVERHSDRQDMRRVSLYIRWQALTITCRQKRMKQVDIRHTKPNTNIRCF